MRYDHWAIRWMFFFAGLSGCTMIGTGMLFWMRARIRKGMEPASVRVVRALSVGIMPGIIAASGAFLIANRVLPMEARLGGLDRAALEVTVFFGVWGLTFAHGALRGKVAWREECWLIAAIAGLAPILNWVTTGDFVVGQVLAGSAAVAGTDLVLMASCGIAIVVARRLAKTERYERGEAPAKAVLPPGGLARTP
ncbi:MAG: PepSY domain-containing protein, partial [Pseudomonadota bacterium]